MQYDLSRFTSAHQMSFAKALTEVKNGRKETHWMWYIFPQIIGLGYSEISLYYSIKDTGEARAFLADEYLGGNLRQITKALAELDTDDPYDVFQNDALKLHSSMTLFAIADGDGSIFGKILDKFFNGIPDQNTLSILSELNNKKEA